MQVSRSFIAVGIGALIAFSPSEVVRSQTASSEPSKKDGRVSITESVSSHQPASDAQVDGTNLSDHLGDVSQQPDVTDEPVSITEATEVEQEAIAAENATSTTEATEVDLEPPATSNAAPEIEATLSEASEAAQATEQSDEPEAARDEAVPATDDETEESAPTDEPAPSLDEAVPEIDASPSQSSPDSDAESSATEPALEPAPEYLNPNPNPLFFPTQPQEVEVQGTQPITLIQAIELARRNNRELEVAELELERSRSALREAEAALLPTVGAGVDLTVVENDVEEGTIFQAGVEDDANLNLSGSLQINYDLYTSGRRRAVIRANEAQVRFNELQVESLVEQLVLDVTNDYYDVQEADEQVRISRATLEQSEQSLRDAEALERAGVGTRFDVLQAQVDVANAQQQLRQDLSSQQIARRQLAQRLSLAETFDVAAADPVAPADPWDISLEDSIVMAYRNRAELEGQLLQREIAEQQRRAALAALGPQVSLFAQYSVSDVLNQDLPGQTELRDQYSFGAQLQWTLFDGGAARAAARQEEINTAIAETQFADTRNQVRFAVEQAYYTLQANYENISTANLALEQARESLRLARLRFQAGVGTQSDVLRSQTELTRAETNLVGAILGYNRSLVSLRRAISNFPDGILSDLP
jgi:OMF family outer membrane factor